LWWRGGGRFLGDRFWRRWGFDGVVVVMVLALGVWWHWGFGDVGFLVVMEFWW